MLSDTRRSTYGIVEPIAARYERLTALRDERKMLHREYRAIFQDTTLSGSERYAALSVLIRRIEAIRVEARLLLCGIPDTQNRKESDRKK